MHLVQAGVVTTTAWRTYRRPRLAAGALLASIGESMWLARRLRVRGALDDKTAVCVDAGAGIGGLVALRVATRSADCTSWLNWACPVNLGTVSGAAAALSGHDARIVAALVSLTYLGSVADTVTDDPSVLTTAIASLLGYAGYVHATGRFARYLRGSATEIDAAHADGIEQGEGLALARERVRQNRLLGQSTLDALDLVALGWEDDMDLAVRERVRYAAAQLRSILQGGIFDDGTFGDVLQGLVQEFTGSGLRVEFVAADLLNEPAPAVIAVFATAIRAALDNVAQHAGTTQVVLRVDATPDRLEVTVRDYGVGFDSHGATSSGHGIERLIVTPLDDIGGRAEVRAIPGRGVQVTLQAPTHASR